jgi:hypothetical protein
MNQRSPKTRWHNIWYFFSCHREGPKALTWTFSFFMKSPTEGYNGGGSHTQPHITIISKDNNKKLTSTIPHTESSSSLGAELDLPTIPTVWQPDPAGGNGVHSLACHNIPHTASSSSLGAELDLLPIPTVWQPNQGRRGSYPELQVGWRPTRPYKQTNTRSNVGRMPCMHVSMSLRQ